MHEAFAAALDPVAEEVGLPDNPRPWLISTAQFKTMDLLIERARINASQEDDSCNIWKRNGVGPKGSFQ